MDKAKELDKYQKLSAFTDLLPFGNVGLYATFMGFAAAQGKLGNELKKAIRDHDENVLDFEVSQRLLDAIGDNLWFIARLSARLGYNLSDVATHNINTLIERKTRNEIGKGVER